MMAGDKHHEMISVIIPCYDSPSTIASSIGCVIESLEGKDHEIILVDDGSAVPISGLALGLPACVKVIRNERNEGAASSRNRGFNSSRGHVLIFVDSDVCVDKGALPALCQGLSSSDISFPIIMFQDGETMHPVTAREREYIHFSTCFAMKRESADLLVRKDGYFFDEAFRTYGEDTDFFIRCKRNGLTCAYVQGAKAVHGKQPMVESEDRFFWEVRNISLGRLKHLKDRENRRFFGNSFSRISILKAFACCVFNFPWYDWRAYDRRDGPASKIGCLLSNEKAISSGGLWKRLGTFSRAMTQSRKTYKERIKARRRSISQAHHSK
jgi:glycosyltransferase involved in cell wall biosynthesis